MSISPHVLDTVHEHMTPAFDAALARIAALASRLDVVAAEPNGYDEATGPGSIGFLQRMSHLGEGFAVSAPQPCEDGRQCIVTPLANGVVTRMGTPRFWALTGQGELLATGKIPDALAVSPGFEFRLPPVACQIVCESESDV